MNTEKEKISRVKKAILTADQNFSLKNIIDRDRPAFSGIRMLYSTNSSGVDLQIDDALKHIISGIFSKDRLLAYSDSIRNEMELGASVISFKKIVLLDTNLLSDLPKYFKGDDITTTEKVRDVLIAIERVYKGEFNYLFAVLENLRQFTCDNNPHPVNKASAAIYFKHKLKGDIYGSNMEGDIFEPYIEQAESDWMDFRSSKVMWSLIDRRDLIYAVMLKTYHICWTSANITTERALHNLVDYCLDELGVLPLKEIYFAWKVVIGFSVGFFTPVFDESSLKSPKSDSVKRIGALAWDLFIFRFTETLLTAEKGNNFYIPSVTTLDKGLLDTISSCPVKAMISFPELKYVETIFEDELQFQQDLDFSMSAKQKERILDASRDIKGAKKSRQYMSISISKLEKSIKKLSPKC